MEKIYELSGCKLVVMYEEGLIRITEHQALLKFLSKDIEARSRVFVNAIKTDYFLLFQCELEISNESIEVEIWGHVFASYFAKAMKNLIKLNLIEDTANFIIKRSDTIDCGEAAIDDNRKFWDVLANFKKVILAFTQKN